MRGKSSSFERNIGASAAVEFALTLPCLIVLLLGGVAFGVVETAVHSVQQLAAEAARASIGGLSAGERASIARAFVVNNAASYAFLDPAKITLAVSDGAPPDYAFSVAITADLTESPIYGLGGLIPLPSPSITRTAVVRRGGF